MEPQARELPWTRGPARVSAQWVLRENGESYVFTARDARQAMFDLAAVREPKDVQAFVKAWGLLESGGENPEPESLSMWFEVARQLGQTLRDVHSLRGAEDPELQELRRTVELYVTTWLQENPPTLTYDHEGGFSLVSGAGDLKTAVQIALANLLVSGAKLRICEGCSRVFEPSTGQQRFHNKNCSKRAWERRQRDGENG